MHQKQLAQVFQVEYLLIDEGGIWDLENAISDYLGTQNSQNFLARRQTTRLIRSSIPACDKQQQIHWPVSLTGRTPFLCWQGEAVESFSVTFKPFSSFSARLSWPSSSWDWFGREPISLAPWEASWLACYWLQQDLPRNISTPVLPVARRIRGQRLLP